MLIINLLHSIFFVVYLGLAIYLLNKNKTAGLHRAIFMLMLSSATQSLSLMVIHYPMVDMHLANFFMDIFSISITAFGVFAFLGFVFITRLYKPGVFTYSILGLYIAGFTVYQLSTGFAHVAIRGPDGLWIMEFDNQGVLLALDIVHNILLITGFIMLFIYLRRNKDALKRKQARVILITGLISYGFSLSTILVSSLFDKSRLPMLNDIYTSVFIIGFVYSIVR